MKKIPSGKNLKEKKVVYFKTKNSTKYKDKVVIMIKISIQEGIQP